jgi:hypothetical protein
MARNLGDSGYTAVSGTFDASLKEFYDGAMQSLVANFFPVVDWLQKEGRVRKVKPQGKYIVFGVETKMGSGFGPRGENDYLPTADQVDVVQGKVPYQRGLKGRIQLSAEAMKFGREGPGSFTNVLKQEMNGAMIAMRQQASPAIWGQGDGVLASVNGAVAGDTTVTVDSSETYNACYPGTRWLSEGMKLISCNTPANNYATDMAAAIEVDSVTSDTVFEFASNATITDDYVLVEHHCSDKTNSTEVTKGSVSLGTASSYRGPQGITLMVDDGTRAGTYCNINSTTTPQWKAIKNHASGTARSLTLDLIYQTFWKLGRKVGTLSPKVVSWMNTDMHRELVKLLEHFVEFKPRSLKPGFQAFDLMVHGTPIPIRLDYQCPSYIYFLDAGAITFAQGCPPELAKETGSMWRFVADKDSYEAVWRWIFQIYSRKRNRHAILEDITVDIQSI